MDGAHFDHFARLWAQRRLSRRGALLASGLGLSGVMLRRSGIAAQGTPSACPSASADEVNIDGAWLCNQPYALCNTAPCEPSASDPTIAVCPCVAMNGYSFGFSSCQERAPSATTLISTFSLQNVNDAFHHMSCPEDAPWANCLDMPCEIDASDPALATCSCPIIKSGPSVTFGGGCDASTCSSTIWSASTPPGVGAQYMAALQCVGQTATMPTSCPVATPSAG